MSAKTVEKRRKRAFPPYLMLCKGRYKIWIISDEAKVLNGHLVGSNQLLLDVRKNVREAYGSKNDKDIVDIEVSYDGSWLTRGHTSNIGVGCVIDLLTGFVIDYEVMSKRCGECEQIIFELEEDSAEFRIWYEGHQDVSRATHVG
ncbi:uncharacterized protein TNCV_1958921 [Trichonephila clavipes]|nr:uncharacterized protein TNCV_1958921 [Trichonephila clavipes]